MISWGADPLVTADSRVYDKAAPTECAPHRSFLEAPRALAMIRLLLSYGAPAGEHVVDCLREMDQLRCKFVANGLPERISQEEFDEASAALSELCVLFGVEQREAKPAPVVEGEACLPLARCPCGCLADSGISLSPTVASVRRCRARPFAFWGGSATRSMRTAASTGVVSVGRCWISI